MNVIDEAGVLAISTRLQRLSDRIRKDGLLIYKEFDFDFEPKWFPVVYTLYKKAGISVVELASEIGYAHPSTISLLKELEKQKLVISKKDKTDERKRLIELTKKGNDLVKQIQPVWELISSVTTEFLNTDNHLLKAVEEVEEQLDNQSFYQRAKKKISAKQKSRK